MVHRGVKSEAGYTLIEVLIALTILSIVISLVSVSFIFASNRMAEWQKQIAFYNQFNMVNNQLYNDLFRAEHFTYSDTSLVIEQNEESQKRYSWADGNLRINDNPVSVERDSTWIHIVKEEAPHTNESIIKYSITQKKLNRELSDSAYIKVRRPIMWKSVNDEEE